MAESMSADTYRRRAKTLRDIACLSPLSAASKDIVIAAAHLDALAEQIEKAAKLADQAFSV
jgi:hypothetical protein